MANHLYWVIPSIIGSWLLQMVIPIMIPIIDCLSHLFTTDFSLGWPVEAHCPAQICNALATRTCPQTGFFFETVALQLCKVYTHYIYTHTRICTCIRSAYMYINHLKHCVSVFTPYIQSMMYSILTGRCHHFDRHLEPMDGRNGWSGCGAGLPNHTRWCPPSYKLFF